MVFLEILWLVLRIVILSVALFALYLEIEDPIILNIFKSKKNDKQKKVRRKVS